MSEGFHVDVGIPFPERRGRRLSEFGKVLRSLQVGESVFIKRPRNYVSRLAHYHLGKGNYTCYVEADGVRIWRTK